MKKFLDYRILLILWFCLGSLYVGYSFILIEVHDKQYYEFDFYVSVLLTVVGVIFIGGVGYIISKKSEITLSAISLIGLIKTYLN